MNKASLIKELNKLKEKYPVSQCKKNREYTLTHMTGVYKITCCIADQVSNNLLTKKTARTYGKILRQSEYYKGEAGLEHFRMFSGV